jgi:hypothetical protein
MLRNQRTRAALAHAFRDNEAKFRGGPCRIVAPGKASIGVSVVENIDNDAPFTNGPPRRELLKTWYPRWPGLDIDATAIK